MLELFLFVVALAPIGFLLFMQFVAGWDQKQIIPSMWLITTVIALLVWRMDFLQIIASSLQGFLWGFEIIYIVLSCLFISHAISQSNILTIIRTWFTQISPDRRIQAILVAWFLGGGLDCMIGFAATSIITCGILAGIGFPPACAVMVGVVGIMTSSAFCSTGSPILLGMAHGLESPEFIQRLSMAGYNFQDYIRIVSAKIGIIHGIAGMFVPLMIVMVMSRFFGRNRSWTDALSIAPFALFAGIAFAIPYALTAIVSGPAFPSLVGALIGLAITVTAVRLKFLIPHDHWEFPPKEEWRSDWFPKKFTPIPTEWMPLWKTLFPFTLLIILVFITRWSHSSFPALLKSYAFRWPNFLGTNVTLSFETLFNHGTLLIIVFFVCMAFFHHIMQHVQAAVTPTFVMTVPMIMRLPLTIATACIYLNSGINHSHFLSMGETLARGVMYIPGFHFFLPFICPFIGAATTFLFDTHAFSNLILANFQYHLGNYSIASGTLFLALQAVGASVGNLYATHYLVRTSATVGMTGSFEASTGRRLLVPILAYLIIAGLVGMGFAYIWNTPDPLRINF